MISRQHIYRVLGLCVIQILLFSFLNAGNAQNAVGIGTENPNENAVLELVSVENNQGLLVPKMTTTQRTDVGFVGGLSSAENGLLVFDTDENKFFYWQDTQWQEINTGLGLVAGIGIDITGNVISSLGDADADPQNEIQDLSAVLSQGSDAGGAVITNSGDPVQSQDVATKSYVDALNLTNADSDPTNEIQDLSLSSNQLSISNSATIIDLSPYLDNSDSQNAANVPVTPAGNLLSADVQSALEELQSYIDSDADSDPVNEIQNAVAVPVSPNGNLLSTNVQSALEELQSDVDLDLDNDPLNEIQNAAGVSVVPSGNLVSTDVQSALTELQSDVDADTDPDSSNELQDISISGNTVDISSGSGFNLSPVAPSPGHVLKWNGSQWEAAIDVTAAGSTLPVLGNAEIVTNDGFSNINVPVSGDVIMNNTGQFTIQPNAISSPEITDGSISNSDISVSAAISASKLQSTVVVEGENVSLLTNDSGYLTVVTNGDITSVDPAKLTQSGATDGQALKWNNTMGQWEPALDLVDDADNDPANEYQDLTFGSDVLGLTNSAATFDLSGYLDNTDNQDAGQVAVTPSGTLGSSDVQSALEELQSDIDLDLDSDPTNELQDASAVSVSPSGNLASTDVQGALVELQGDIDLDLDLDPTNEHQDLTLATDLLGLTNSASSVDLSSYLDNTDNQNAGQVSVTPGGNLSSTDVQAALEEIQGDIDLDLDNDATNELNSGGSLEANNLLRIVDSGGNTDIDLSRLTGDLDANSNRINNLTDPAVAQDAATKAYVDTEIAGNSWGIAGNSGIGAFDFIGTTDGNDLPFRVNNLEHMRLRQGGWLGVGSAGTTNVRLNVDNSTGVDTDLIRGSFSTSAASGNGSAFQATVNASGGASISGIYSTVTQDGTGSSDAHFALISGSGNGIRTGFNANVSGGGTGVKYGVRSSLNVTSGAAGYGVYVADVTGATRNYGIYAESVSNQPGFYPAIFLDGNVGIGLTNPSSELDVNGTIETNGIQMSTGAVPGYVLFSDDASGNASWQPVPSPFNAANNIPKGDGTGLVSSIIYDDGSGHIGINEATPNAGLHVSQDDGALFTGLFGSGTIPATGASTRMMWYSGKGAFRVGRTTTTDWDDANIGSYSMGLGFNGVASGAYSLSLGNDNDISAFQSFGIGTNNDVIQQQSFGLGFNNSTNSVFSGAIGWDNSTNQDSAFAIGHWLQADNIASFVIGKGENPGSKLVNDVANSLMVGFNSTVPTFFVGPSFGFGSTGSVGIGNSSPQQKLDVNGAIRIGNGFAAAAGSMRWTGSDFQGYDGGSWRTFFSPWTESGGINYYNSGRVAIGTSTVESNYNMELEVPSAAAQPYGFYLDNTYDGGISYGQWINMDNDGASSSYGLIVSSPGATAARKYGIYSFNETDNYLQGNLGIGDVFPDEKLHVAGNIKTDGGFSVDSDSFRDVTDPANNYISWDAGGELRLVSNLNTLIYGQTDGKVRIGTQFNAGSSRLLVQGFGFGTGEGLLVRSSLGTTNLMVLDNGRVGIRRTPTTYNLEVQGNAGKTTGGVDWVTISDQRLKKNVEEFSDGLEEILKVNPVRFQYNNLAPSPDKETKYVGVLAQEIRKVLPYMVLEMNDVVTDNNGKEFNILNYDNSAMTFILINAVKELHAENQQLKDQIQSQSARLNTLNTALLRIEQKLSDMEDGHRAQQTEKE